MTTIDIRTFSLHFLPASTRTCTTKRVVTAFLLTIASASLVEKPLKQGSPSRAYMYRFLARCNASSRPMPPRSTVESCVTLLGGFRTARSRSDGGSARTRVEFSVASHFHCVEYSPAIDIDIVRTLQAAQVIGPRI